MQKVTQMSPHRHNARMRDRGLVGTGTVTSYLSIAEDRWRVGACDLGLSRAVLVVVNASQPPGLLVSGI